MATRHPAPVRRWIPASPLRHDSYLLYKKLAVKASPGSQSLDSLPDGIAVVVLATNSHPFSFSVATPPTAKRRWGKEMKEKDRRAEVMASKAGRRVCGSLNVDGAEPECPGCVCVLWGVTVVTEAVVTIATATEGGWSDWSVWVWMEEADWFDVSFWADVLNLEQSFGSLLKTQWRKPEPPDPKCLRGTFYLPAFVFVFLFFIILDLPLFGVHESTVPNGLVRRLCSDVKGQTCLWLYFSFIREEF